MRDDMQQVTVSNTKGKGKKTRTGTHTFATDNDASVRVAVCERAEELCHAMKHALLHERIVDLELLSNVLLLR